jgi:predicted transcriptional regulator
MADATESPNYTRLTVDIVSAFVGHNSLTTAELPALIASVQAALAKAATGKAEEPAAPQDPAVPIKKSVTADYIICLEDGKKFKSLKRHLRTAYNMTPEQYRAKWNLPGDYPMVAPNYAQARSELAKTMGLGQKRRKSSPAKGGASAKGRRTSSKSRSSMSESSKSCFDSATLGICRG